MATEESYEVEDESIQPAKIREITRLLVEPNISIVDNRYEIPVPMKKLVTDVSPNNFNYALECTVLLRRQALKNSKMKCTLIETFDELISAGWLAPVGNALKKNSYWYFPFFVIKQKKPRVVFDGAALYKGCSLNDAVYPRINLSNGLVEV